MHMNIILFPILISVISVWLMIRKRKQIEGVDQSPLVGRLLFVVILLEILSPIISQAIFYYGWKKKLPEKAKRANLIGWIIFLLLIVFLKPINLVINNLSSQIRTSASKVSFETTAPIVSTSTEGWKVCKNEVYGYEFRYPNTWKMKQYKNINNKLIKTELNDCSEAEVSFRPIVFYSSQSFQIPPLSFTDDQGNKITECSPAFQFSISSSKELSYSGKLDDDYVMEHGFLMPNPPFSKIYSIGGSHFFTTVETTKYFDLKEQTPCVLPEILSVAAYNSKDLIYLKSNGIDLSVIESLLSTFTFVNQSR